MTHIILVTVLDYFSDIAKYFDEVDFEIFVDYFPYDVSEQISISDCLEYEGKPDEVAGQLAQEGLIECVIDKSTADIIRGKDGSRTLSGTMTISRNWKEYTEGEK